MPIQSFTEQDEEAGSCVGVPGPIYAEGKDGEIFLVRFSSTHPGHLRQSSEGNVYFLADAEPGGKDIGVSVWFERLI